MRVLVIVTCCDYGDCGVSDEGILVPDDFDQQAEHQKWAEETLVPATGKNQYGEWKSKKYKERTIHFAEWLRKRYEVVKVEECSYW